MNILRYQTQDLDFIRMMKAQANVIRGDSSIQQVLVRREDFMRLIDQYLPPLPEELFKK
jgi:hypothetical protein